MKKFSVVKFHTPLADESPASRYLLRDDPDESRKHAEELNKKYPQSPIKPRVDVEYLGEMVDGKLVPTTLTFRPISTVLADDLEVEPTLAYETRGGCFEIRPA
jgi:hypothetical protein